MVRPILRFRSLLIVACLSPLLYAQPHFNRDIAPILSDNCYQCHGPDAEARQADLRLDQQASLQEVAGSGSNDNSVLLQRVMSEDPDEVMPPPASQRTLTPQQKRLLREWVNAGAKWEAHWSFEKPVRPKLPTVENADWTHNAIDRFVLSHSERRQLEHSSEASKERILRRVTLDLTGIPPTLEEMDLFLGDKSPQSYDRVVQRLLASPRFGERMAMSWLDAARYADSNGYQGDRERTMWPWRDWVVKAFNDGLRYDEFTVWQLAGDLLPNGTSEQRLATGFCRNHMINGEGGRIAEENRAEYIFDQIETLGTVWMGLTVQCCRCHDHKFDALSQREYYKLFAFFNQTPVNGGGGDPQMAPVMEAPTRKQRESLQSLTSQLEVLRHRLQTNESHYTDLPTDIQKIIDTTPQNRNPEQWKTYLGHFAAQQPDLAATVHGYQTSKAALAEVRSNIAKVMVMQEQPVDQQRATYVLFKGLYNQKREEVSAGTPSAIRLALPQRRPDRLALARWLTSKDHPLTARVAVNQIWQRFFGTGLVKTTEDFGVQGEKPSHPRLLDWLACEFVESDWDIKHLVRCIVTSATYRQSAVGTPNSFREDPENRWLARGPRRRMPSWMIRDHALASAGLLVGQLGGPPVYPYQPTGVWEEASFGNKKYRQDQGQALYRRSLYVFWRRIVGPTMFFDAPKRQTCSVRAGQTNTPLHALVTMNDTTYVEAARGLAHRVLTSEPEDAARICQAFRLVASRKPSASVVHLLTQRLQMLREYYLANPDDAKQLVQVGEWNSRGTLPQEEIASYTALCLTLLNLDEALSK